LNNFCIVYINNILIYNNIETKYKNYINKVFAKFYNADFYLDINKCVFFVKQVKYLNLIIIIERIRIDSKKIKYILEWKTSICMRDMQVFLDFVNFYRQFIYNYSSLVKSLLALSKLENKSLSFL